MRYWQILFENNKNKALKDIVYFKFDIEGSFVFFNPDFRNYVYEIAKSKGYTPNNIYNIVEIKKILYVEGIKDELIDFAKSSGRYDDFTFLDEPLPFKLCFKDKNFDKVQLHFITDISSPSSARAVGCCGYFSWKDNTLTPLDDDTYNENVYVFGYKRWNRAKDNVEYDLDIIVEDDW